MSVSKTTTQRLKKNARERLYYRQNEDQVREKHRRYYAANKEKRTASIRKWRTANKEKCREMCRSWRAANPEKVSESNFKNKKYPMATRSCPTSCECCGKSSNGKGKLHLDHCHTLEIFRGWLCYKCNVAIGLLGDTKAGVIQAVQYLSRADGIDTGSGRLQGS